MSRQSITNLNRELRVARRKITQLKQENQLLKEELRIKGRFTGRDLVFAIILFEVANLLLAMSINKVF